MNTDVKPDRRLVVPNFVRLLAAVGALFLLVTTSCNKSKESESGAQKRQRGHDYLQALIPMGESVTNIIQKFGPPSQTFETPWKTLGLSFQFRDDDEKAFAAGVGGFTAYFASNCLTDWRPIYVTRISSTKVLPIKHEPVSFHSEKPVLAFCLVSEEPKEGSIYIDDSQYPKLGYVNKSPDLPIFSGKYTLYEYGNKSISLVDGQVEFDLSDADGKKLRELTAGNIGKRMAIMVDSQVVIAPRIQSTVSDGRVSITASGMAYSNLLQTLRAQRK